MEVVDAEAVERPFRPWGFWATVGFSVIVVAAFVAVQTAVSAVYFSLIALRQRGANPSGVADGMEHYGLLLSLATCLTAPICCGLVALFAMLRKPSSVRKYLALERVSPATMVGWLLLLVLFAGCTDGLTLALGRPVIPEFMIETYSTAGFVPLLWIAVVLMAPLFEEVFFRGFVFQGIRHSPLGVPGAVVLTSLAWAGPHVQYDWYQMAIIFAGGILLGVARWRSKSVYPPLAMHAAMNLIATVEVAVYLR